MDSHIYEECLAKRKKEKYLDVSWDSMANMFGYNNGNQLRKQFERIYEKVLIETSEDDEFEPEDKEEKNYSQRESRSYEEGKDFINIVCSSKRMLSQEDIIKEFNIDLNVWEIEKFRVRSNEAYRKDRKVDWHVENGYVTKGDVEDSGKMLIVPLFNVEVRLIKRKQPWSEDIVKRLFENLEKKDFNRLKYTPNYVKNGEILFVPIVDLHYGMLATQKATGNVYNMSIAEHLVEKAISQILYRINGKKYEKVILLIGNDFLNCDNLSGTTTAGTPQDNDGSWFDLIDGATELVIKMIESFLPIAPVEVYSINSNHDTHSFYGVSKSVEFYFKNDNNVTFENSPLPRKYYIFGKNIIAFTHDIPIKRALEIITSEAKSSWSNATHMYWFLAHLHTGMEYEKQGYLEIYRIPTISGWSRWTNEKGYQQTEKKTQCFVFDKENGITEIMNIVVN